jgi:hypothetical protein
VGEGLLSLIPHLIKASGRCLVAGCGCGWVEHFRCLSVLSSPSGGGGLDTLLGPEETPVGGVVLGAISGVAGLTRGVPCFVVGVLCGGGVVVGVWLCVECCIVDASILLWSSV